MKYNTKHLFSLAIALIFAIPSNAQLDQRINELLQHPDLEFAEIGISILDESGKALFSKNADQNLIPASLMKILSSFTALEILGPDYKFKTTIGYTGEILSDGNLTGDIIIYGNGDPSLASERYQKRPQIKDVVDQIHAFIKKAGITCIDGKIISDASYYGSDGTIHSWSWDDVGNYYAANIWSINLHENYYNLYFQLSEDQNLPPKIISHQPFIPGLSFENELKSGPSGSGDQAYIFGGPYNDNKIVRGSLPMGKNTYKIKGAIPNSPKYLSDLVLQNLAGNNISCTGSSVEFHNRISGVSEIGKINSPSLQDLIVSANLESINLFCESFLVAVGKGDRKSGIKNVKEYLAENQIDSSDIYIVDGSGLSFWNAASAKDFALLIKKLKSKYGDSLNRYFPEAGETGTLSYLFRNSEAKGKLWAKTGSMNQVMNYAGFSKCKSGKEVSFCLMINRHKASNRKVRRILEQIMNTIYLEA